MRWGGGQQKALSSAHRVKENATYALSAGRRKSGEMRFNLILDSGAFSAWTKEKPINVETYIEFIHNHHEKFTYIVGLDVIPATFGQTSISALEQEDAARRGWLNYLTMVERGVPDNKLLHVFHMGESFKWLKKAIYKMDYIGLSPANDCNTKQKIRWLDECMEYVLEDGDPVVKFHGFGVTSMEIMHRYPWYSVDSSSWVTFSRFGTILIPFLNALGEFIHIRPPNTVQVTLRAPSRKENNLKHFNNLPIEMKAIIAKYIEDNGLPIGKSKMVDGKEEVIRHGVVNNHRLRDLLNLFFYVDGAKSAGCKFFVAGNFPQMKDPALEKECYELLCSKQGEYNRLVSYWFHDDTLNVMKVKEEIDASS